MEELEESRDVEHYHPNACHVCQSFGADITLKRCGNCKAIAYCGRNHQNTHWPKHKELCRILQEKWRKFGTIYQVSRFSQHENPWHLAKMALMLEVYFIFMSKGLTLALYEVEMLCGPRCCEICGEMDFKKLTDCKDCPDTSFCINHPKDEQHTVKCKILRVSFGIERESPTFGNIVVPLERGISFPENMNRAIGVFAAYCHISMLFESDHVWAAILADRLTKPYTFWYAIKKLSRPPLRTMTIHIIDMRQQIIKNPYFWHYLFHYERYLRELKIVFICLELFDATIEIPLCEKCIRKRRTISMQTVRNEYNVFAEGESFTTPDFVVGFDLKILIHSDFLAPTITTVSQLGCPFILTSVCPATSKANEAQINSILERNVRVFWEGENPFHGWRPVKTIGSRDFFYENEYLTIYERLS